MNHLPVVDSDRWQLPRHAHVIVHETRDRSEFLTIYDCGAAQKPPSAQLLGNLIRVDADYELINQPNGYIAKLREKAILERQDDGHWIIRTDDSDASDG